MSENEVIIERRDGYVVIGVTDSDLMWHEKGVRIRLTLEEARELVYKLEEEAEIDMTDSDILARDKTRAELAEREAQRVAQIHDALANPPAPPDPDLADDGHVYRDVERL